MVVVVVVEVVLVDDVPTAPWPEGLTASSLMAVRGAVLCHEGSVRREIAAPAPKRNERVATRRHVCDLRRDSTAM